MWTYNKLRAKFLEYFIANEHTCVPSASLIPQDDPSLLFVNAGMVPFKNNFLGIDQPVSTRLCSSQRCLRVGGKHNDLEQVGFTARHHTLFEMLGNFSFGDYFKHRAIQMAWQFVTEELQIPVSRLYVTVHESDLEAESIWINDIGVAPDRVIRCGDADNFWSMGDVGPCGPCSEIFYDHGSDCEGGLPGTEDQDGDRYMEIWNLVFMQYQKHADGSMTDLPKPSVDTGMGLERLAAVMQGKIDTYDIDLFSQMMQVVKDQSDVPLPRHALKILVDHLRAAMWLIADQVTPSNEGQGYILRRLLRRAARLAYQAGMSLPGMHRLIPSFCQIIEPQGGVLTDMCDVISQRIEREEAQFVRTLTQGLKVLDDSCQGMNTIAGDLAFKLYDTFGFPVDITKDYAREYKLSFDEDGFHQLMQSQKERSKSAKGFQDKSRQLDFSDVSTNFIGYDCVSSDARIQQIWHMGSLDAPVASAEKQHEIKEGQCGFVICDETPCYAESGGQVGDRAVMTIGSAVFEVIDTFSYGGVICHKGVMRSGAMKVGMQVAITVDSTRGDIIRNHSGTHLLHAALRAICGKHVVQKGSLVDAARLRFDFAHHEPLTQQEIRSVESWVNDLIRQNIPAEVVSMPLAEAMAGQAMALFGEKYADPVRVVKFQDYSIELCGGTHVASTGDIGCFKITSETGVAAGIRRIEAVTGKGCVEWWQKMEADILELERQVKAPLDQISTRFADLRKSLKEAKTQQDKQQRDQHGDWIKDQIAQQQKTVIAFHEGYQHRQLMQMADQLLQGGIVCVILFSGTSGSYPYVIATAKEAVPCARDILAFMKNELDVSGGGRADRVQGVIKDARSHDQLKDWITSQTSS